MDADKSDEKPILRGDKGHFLPGTVAGPGRPAGSISIVGRIKQIFEEDPERFETYVAEVIKDPRLKQELIRQIDGAPRQNLDLTTGGEPITFAVVSYANPNPLPLPTTDIPASAA